MTNLKVNLNSISKRALGFLEKPQFLKMDLKEDFVVTLDQSDSILTVFHSGKCGEIELIFSEVLAIFSKNRKISDLWKINFREIENFLRDENHLPAFPENTQNIEETLLKTKITLIGNASKALFKKSFAEDKKALFAWENLNLVAKNQWAQNFSKVLGWEFVFCDGKILNVSGTPEGVSNDGLNLLMNAIFEGPEVGLPLKVVAVQ